MQPYFFPYIGYWQLLNLVDTYVIYDDVNYIKRGWINRNQILLNGKEKRINLHIRDASQNRLICDTELAQTEEDNRKLLETITQAYHKAPYFCQTFEVINRILEYPEKNLAKYLTNQIYEMCEYFDIHTKIVLSSVVNKNNSLKGEEKIISICKELEGDCYINAIGGKGLYHPKNFRAEGMQLQFLKTGEVHYNQASERFIPSLSIIDVMMYNKVDDVKKLLEIYTLEKGL